MTINSKEHHELMAMFERRFASFGRMDREEKSFWPNGNVYQDGRVNELFKAFREGVAYGTAVGA